MKKTIKALLIASLLLFTAGCSDSVIRTDKPMIVVKVYRSILGAHYHQLKGISDNAANRTTITLRSNAKMYSVGDTLTLVKKNGHK